ncbi:hypothetical protein QWJ26_05895 [Streptomyces sp. CSDS2]|uniref:hypothetical protein n=1 Tax=Streptomyces sp. CSDS2 TaxID=3055051 RepID=UPI0025B2286F|nr:hypothetical protein [Streptomyces sp. CSDS2]MDN3259352.1 hypothetical protein [Streptomyces sp. CSDS2]
MAEQKSSSVLTAPLHGAASVLRRVPGAGTVGRAAEETLDKIGAVSPRGRRMAVYAGAGVLGVAGVVEWPVALTGAAVAWLTQPRPDRPARAGDTGQRPEPAHDLGTAALRSGAGHGQAVEGAPGGSGSHAAGHAPGRAKGPGHTEAPGPPAAGHGAGTPPTRTSSGPLGPTARPDRTTL